MSDADTIATLRAQLDSTLKDRAQIRAERDDARLAVALAYQRATEIRVTGIVGMAELRPETKAAIRALADTDALAEVQALIAALEKAFAWMGRVEGYYMGNEYDRDHEEVYAALSAIRAGTEGGITAEPTSPATD